MTNLEDLTTRMKPKSASNILLWAIVAFFVIFVGWAALTELDRSVRAIGRVIPRAQLQIVSNLEGGILEAILVQPGQMVAQGDELVRLDRTQTGAEFGSGQASVEALSAKIARLQAEVTGRQPAYPAAASAASGQQIAVERALHAARLAELSSVENAGRARITQAEQALAEAQAAQAARITARETKAAEVAVLRPLVEKGIEPRLSLSEAESEAAIAASEAASAAAGVARARAGIYEARAALAQQVQNWREKSASELTGAQAELGSRRSAMPALAQRVERTVVRSPLPGRVNRVLVTTVGAAIGPGAPLVEIVPSDRSLLIEARVAPDDIAAVRIGQRAKVNITAYDPSIYGGMEGRVVAISPDAVVDENSGESFFLVRVRTASDAIKHPQGRRLPIEPGMIAEVNLLGEKRTILRYLLTPLTKLQETAFRE